jgi:hypothetical protein
MKLYKYFYAKNLNQQSDCIVSNPRIFKDEAIQVLLHTKIWNDEAIVLLETPESFSDEAIQLILFEAIVWAPYFSGGMRGFADLILP